MFLGAEASEACSRKIRQTQPWSRAPWKIHLNPSPPALERTSSGIAAWVEKPYGKPTYSLTRGSSSFGRSAERSRIQRNLIDADDMGRRRLGRINYLELKGRERRSTSVPEKSRAANAILIHSCRRTQTKIPIPSKLSSQSV